MTLRINLSAVKALPYDFEAEVAKYIKARKDHQKTVGEPAPAAPLLVEGAVKVVPGTIKPPTADDYVADYEIFDDTPPPPTLDQRKAILAGEAAVMGQSAIDKFRPPLKVRLLDMDFNRALSIDENKRTTADKATIAMAYDRAQRIDAITYHLAKMEAQIHDLTEKNIDAWKPAPFPT